MNQNGKAEKNGHKYAIYIPPKAIKTFKSVTLRRIKK